MTVLSNIITPSNVLTTTNTATVTNKTLTSPTVTGMVVSDGTANGVTYLNGSKVLTSGSALTFNGTDLLLASGGLLDIDGTNAAVAMRIRQTTVGAGTEFTTSITENTGVTFDSSDSAGATARSFVWTAAGTEGMRLTSTGLGIGSANPTTKLEVNSGVGATHNIATIRSSNVQFKLGTTDVGNGEVTYNVFPTSNSSAAGAHIWQGGGTERARIDSSGNLLVGGTSSVIGKLEVSVTDTSATADGINIRGTQNNAYGGYLSWSDTWNGDSYRGKIAAILGYREDVGKGQLRFFTYGSSALTERARIDSSGTLTVGTANAAGTSGVGVALNPTANGVRLVSAVSTNASETFSMYSTGASAYRFYVDWSGKVNATNTTIAAISDQRLKENVRDLDDGLGAIMALKPRKFDWKQGKGKDIKDDRGFIAQEFEQVFPDMIDNWKDPSPEGEEPYKSVRADLIPTLVKAIQEQQAIIESLKARLDAANL